MHCFSAESVAFSEENQKWITEEIQKAIHPNGFKKFANGLRYWGVLTACITVFVGLVGVLAGVENGHMHRWRDTFAVELLLAGISLEQVSILLGHASVKVTEKHYAPWVKARQEQLEAVVRKTF